jgi:hypothetical protein
MTTEQNNIQLNDMEQNDTETNNDTQRMTLNEMTCKNNKKQFYAHHILIFASKCGAYPNGTSP